MLRNRQAGMIFILITMFLDVLGLGIIIPVLPQLVTDLSGGDVSDAAPVFGLLIASFALMQFLFAPVLGALSDRVGRRPVILVSLFGFGVNYLLIALAPSLTWLFIARTLSGITGASMTTANAYIADISTPETRARNFGLVGAVFGIGFIFGPAAGGLLGEIGPRVPFYASAVIVGINWIYGWFVLPESLPPEKRRKVSLRDATPLGGVTLLRKYPLVAYLAVAFIFFSLAQRSMEAVWVLYTQYRYSWDELENGLVLAYLGVLLVIVQGGLLRPLVKRFGERSVAIGGLVVSSLGMLLYGLSAEPWMMLAVIVVATLGAVSGPAIQGIVAGAVPSPEQGAVQGALTSLVALTAVFAPLLSTQLFARFSGDDAWLEVPGAPFFMAALLMVVAVFIVAAAFRRHAIEDG